MTDVEEEHIHRGRPPWWLVAVFVVIAAVVVAGLFATGYRGQSSATTTTTRPPQLAALVTRADAIVVGDAVAVRRIGEPRDPAVVATIDVAQAITEPAPPVPVTVYDKGFQETWQAGQHVLLFLSRATGAAAANGARWRVQHRYRFDGDRLVAPFRVADVLAAAHRP